MNQGAVCSEQSAVGNKKLPSACALAHFMFGFQLSLLSEPFLLHRMRYRAVQPKGHE